MIPPLLVLLGGCPGFGTESACSGVTEVPAHPTYVDDAGPILDTYCAPCHGEVPTVSGHDEFRLDEYAGDGEREGAIDKVDRIEFRATGENPTMPRADGAQPCDVERAVLAAWIADGAPYDGDTGGGE